MLYIVYIPKRKGPDESDDGKNLTNIVRVIQEYLKMRPSCSGVICAPGYMSKSDTTISDYWKQTFSEDVLKSNNPSASEPRKLIVRLLNGVSNEDIVDKNKKFLDGLTRFELINGGETSKKDHRKMMLFFHAKHNEIDADNDADFLKQIKIGAVLIGSSNQSFSTYNKLPANKGEADVLLIAAEDKYSGGSELEQFLYNVSDSNIKQYDIDTATQNWKTLLNNNCRITKDITPKELIDDKNMTDDGVFLHKLAEEVLSCDNK